MTSVLMTEEVPPPCELVDGDERGEQIESRMVVHFQLRAKLAGLMVEHFARKLSTQRVDPGRAAYRKSLEQTLKVVEQRIIHLLTCDRRRLQILATRSERLYLKTLPGVSGAKRPAGTKSQILTPEILDELTRTLSSDSALMDFDGIIEGVDWRSYTLVWRAALLVCVYILAGFRSPEHVAELMPQIRTIIPLGPVGDAERALSSLDSLFSSVLATQTARTARLATGIMEKGKGKDATRTSLLQLEVPVRYIWKALPDYVSVYTPEGTT